jgi:hypothetical protein
MDGSMLSVDDGCCQWMMDAMGEMMMMMPNRADPLFLDGFDGDGRLYVET